MKFRRQYLRVPGCNAGMVLGRSYMDAGGASICDVNTCYYSTPNASKRLASTRLYTSFVFYVRLMGQTTISKESLGTTSTPPKF